MKEIPILYSTPMVQALLDKRKTQTRRIVKDEHVLHNLNVNNFIPEYYHNDKDGWCPYGQPGDLLWVRETWLPAAINGNRVLVGYHEKDPDITIEITTDRVEYYWKQLNKGRMIPSIHMPKEAARIWLQVTNIRVERLQDISEEDAMAEGVIGYEHEVLGWRFKDYCADASGYGDPFHDFPAVASAKKSFESLWGKINGPESWEANPWVWAISFKVLSTTGKPLLTEKIN